MSSANGYTNAGPTGLINARHGKPRPQKVSARSFSKRMTTANAPQMKWTAENDRRLLLIGLGKEIVPKEYAIIARVFPEKPTPKAIQERLSKLRAEQLRVLRELNASEPLTTIHEQIVDNEVLKDESLDTVMGATEACLPWKSHGRTNNSLVTESLSPKELAAIKALTMISDDVSMAPDECIKTSKKRAWDADDGPTPAKALRSWANSTNMVDDLSKEELVPLDVLRKAHKLVSNDAAHPTGWR